MLSEELKIYEDTYQFASLVLDVTKNYASEYKYELRSHLVNSALDLFKYIQIANRFPEKREDSLSKYLILLEECKIYIRLSVDKKQLSHNQQAALLEKLIPISKQATSWKNS